MTERTQIIRMAQEGMRPAAIARALRCKPQKVSDVLKAARRAGWDIPDFPRGPASAENNDIVLIPTRVMRDLVPDAEQRGMKTHELITAIIQTVHRHKMVSAVLEMEAKADV